MRLKHKVAVAVAAATLLLGLSAVPAMATVAQQQQCALLTGSDMGSGYIGVYGDPVILNPVSLTSIELPSDKFHFQAYVQDVESSGTGIPTQMVWKDFRDFEDIQLEDTNTVQPFNFNIGQDDDVILSDGSVITPSFPYLIRCEYKPFGNSTVASDGVTAAPTFSETETVSLIKNASTKVTFSKSGTVKHAGTRFNFHVSPACGGISGGDGIVPCIIRVTVAKKGAKTLTYNVATDPNGAVSVTLKLGSKKGTYKVSARFVGNIYGVASKTVSKTFVASH
jgi:hypothetical protein